MVDLPALEAGSRWFESSHLDHGTWLSLVEHYLGVVGVVGSNPAVPTNKLYILDT